MASAGSLIAAGLPVAGSFAFGLWLSLHRDRLRLVGRCHPRKSPRVRAVGSLALIAVAVAYALRAVGDVASGGGNWLSWLSPIGWMQQVRAYAGDRWWVLCCCPPRWPPCVPVAMVLQKSP